MTQLLTFSHRAGRPPRRAGLSLLEVLFAIFVAAVGLLGLAALLTVGGVQTSQSEQADRSAALGRDAFRQVEARGMLLYSVSGQPNWLSPNAPFPQINYPATSYDAARSVILTNPLALDRLDTFVIDPLFVANNGTTDPRGYVFPYFVDCPPDSSAGTVPASLKGLQLPRLTLAGMYNPADLSASRSAAERVFLCRDDVSFYQFQRDDRPNAGLDANRNGALDPTENPDVPIIQGDYSYLVMVTPSELENPVPKVPGTAGYQKSVALDQRRMFTVQVVVFYKRVPIITTASATEVQTPPGERQVPAQVTAQNAILQPSNGALVRGLAPNQWIMLSAFLNPPSDDPTLYRPIHRWVRIVSVGKTQKIDEVRLTFAGPEWNTTATTTGIMAVATIVDNVIGVYERNVEVDVRSFTAP